MHLERSLRGRGTMTQLKLTNKQKKEPVVWKYFMLEQDLRLKITDENLKMFFEWSERGLHKQEANDAIRKNTQTGFGALVRGKRLAGIHMHELYEPGILNGTVPYFTLLGGEDGVPIPREVVDFMKKEMFRGIDAETIEKVYQEIHSKRTKYPPNPPQGGTLTLKKLSTLYSQTTKHKK